MSWTNVMEHSVTKALMVAAILGAWAWLANVDAAQDSIKQDHAVWERTWEEKFDRIHEDILEIKADVKDLRNFSPSNGGRQVLRNPDPNTQGRLDVIEDMLRRQNCFLAGGPTKAPAVCKGINNPEPQR